LNAVIFSVTPDETGLYVQLVHSLYSQLTVKVQPLGFLPQMTLYSRE